jgi:hypothetical protein
MTHATSTDTAKYRVDDYCPKCMAGILERRSHRFSTDRGPNVPDCDWLECDSCDFATDPE